MRDETPIVSTVTVEYQPPVDWPDTPYNLWLNDELGDVLNVPEGSRVEIIAEKVVVSPAPVPTHNLMVTDVAKAFYLAEATRNDFPWETVQASNIQMDTERDAYVPDLIVMDHQTVEMLRESDSSRIMSDEAEMVVEVTSNSNASTDRRPARRSVGNKWNDYARVQIPYYLLVDRDPKVARTTLYSIPDASVRAYLHEESWDFGETIRLPEPFDLKIDTSRWTPWTKR